MKTIEIKLYKFDELSEEAKQKAIESYRYNRLEDFWRDELVASYEKAKELYDELSGIEEEISGARLVAWIENNLSHYWRAINFISKHKDGYAGVVDHMRKKNGYVYRNSDWWHKHDAIKKKVSRVFETNNLTNCPLTGVTYDYDFMEPIINFLKSPSSNVSNFDLVDDMPDYEYVANKEWDVMNEDEFIIEELSNRDEDFTEYGELYP